MIKTREINQSNHYFVYISLVIFLVLVLIESESYCIGFGVAKEEGIDAEIMGMGGAGISLSATSSMYWNPAGMAGLEKIELSWSGKGYPYYELNSENDEAISCRNKWNTQFIGATFPGKKICFGIGKYIRGASLFHAEATYGLVAFDARLKVNTLALAYKIHPKLYGGISYCHDEYPSKFEISEKCGDYQATHFGEEEANSFIFGFLSKLKFTENFDWKAGLVYRSPKRLKGDFYFPYTNTTRETIAQLPGTLGMGTSFNTSRLILAFDVTHAFYDSQFSGPKDSYSDVTDFHFGWRENLEICPYVLGFTLWSHRILWHLESRRIFLLSARDIGLPNISRLILLIIRGHKRQNLE